MPVSHTPSPAPVTIVVAATPAAPVPDAISQEEFWKREAERKMQAERAQAERIRTARLEKKQHKAIRKAKKTGPLERKLSDSFAKAKWTLAKGSVVEGMHEKIMELWVECQAVVSSFPALQLDFLLDRHPGFKSLSAHDQIVLAQGLLEYLHQGLLEGPDALVPYVTVRERHQLRSILLTKDTVKTILVQPSMDVKTSTWVLLGTRLVFSVSLTASGREDPPRFGPNVEAALKLEPVQGVSASSLPPPPLTSSLSSSGLLEECSECHNMRPDVKQYRLISRGETEPRFMCGECIARLTSSSSRGNLTTSSGNLTTSSSSTPTATRR